MIRTDYLVVGAGIAGASVGYELATSGAVVVLERETMPGYHTTGRSAAIYTESYGNAIVRRLTVASRSFLIAPPAGFTEHPLLTPRGVLVFARPEDGERLAAALAEVRALVPSIHAIAPEEACRAVPALRRNCVGGAFLEPDAMDMDVHAIHSGYLRGLAARHGRVVTGAEVRGLTRVGGDWEVETGRGRFRAAVLVNAAGAWCDAVAELAQVTPVGLVPKRRTAITFDPPPGTAVRGWPFTVDVNETIYFRPEGGRLMASPADETPMPPCDVQPDELDVAITVDRLQQATTLDIRRVEHKWAGLRSFVADKTHVVGFEQKVPGFFWLAGQGGHGIQTAPAVARAAAALIRTGALPSDLDDAGLTAAALSPVRLSR
ncbi:MAG: FAD-binding oxidoreductase [Alphaproteobacteria bacterium]|nr:FAD-binding oxidoreductase [Alphaproteobacteria bacterium]